MPKKKRYVVTIEIDMEACPWLKGEVVTVGSIVTETSDVYGCCGPDGTFVEGGGLPCPTELPSAALTLLEDGITEVQEVGNFLN